MKNKYNLDAKKKYTQRNGALADATHIRQDTGTNIPSDDAVEEAKRWVDSNEK